MKEKENLESIVNLSMLFPARNSFPALISEGTPCTEHTLMESVDRAYDDDHDNEYGKEF